MTNQLDDKIKRKVEKANIKPVYAISAENTIKIFALILLIAISITLIISFIWDLAYTYSLFIKLKETLPISIGEDITNWDVFVKAFNNSFWERFILGLILIIPAYIMYRDTDLPLSRYTSTLLLLLVIVIIATAMSITLYIRSQNQIDQFVQRIDHSLPKGPMRQPRKEYLDKFKQERGVRDNNFEKSQRVNPKGLELQIQYN